MQIDGVNDLSVRTALAVTGALDDPRVLVDCNRAFAGPAVTRNLALARTNAPLLQNLDADDLLEPGALAALVAVLVAHPDAGFAVGRARDLFPDGDLRDHPLHLPPGVHRPAHGRFGGVRRSRAGHRDPALSHTSSAALGANEAREIYGRGLHIALIRERVAALGAGPAWRPGARAAE